MTAATPGIREYAAAAVPAVAVETVEEERLIASLLTMFADRSVHRVSATGLTDCRTGDHDPNIKFGAAFAMAAQAKQDHVLVVLDCQHMIMHAGIYRALRDAFAGCRRHRVGTVACATLIVLVAPSWKLPAELEHEVPVLQWARPTRTELEAELDRVQHDSMSADPPLFAAVPEAAERTAALDAAAGLPATQAADAFSLAAVTAASFDRSLIEQTKLRLVKGTGYMEVWPPVSVSDLGGLGGLKEFFRDEVLPAKDNARTAVRGLLLVGVSGAGKSLATKVAGALLAWPVVRLDIGACMAGLVGESERRLRDALRLAEAIAPAVLAIDEIEKAVGGYASSAQSDSGVTLRLVSTLLTWLQEHTSAILTVATCNDHAKLPTELTRAGRFDQTFFVDLPSMSERGDIAAIHLVRYGVLADHNAIAAMSEDWTGAEIEQLIKSAARRARGGAVTAEVLATAAASIRPVAQVRPQETAALREWGKRLVRANSPEVHEMDAGLARLLRSA